MKYSLLNQVAQRWADYGVRRSATAEALCERLEGRSLLVDPGSEGLCTVLVVREGRLVVSNGDIDKPDATLSGSLLSLAAMAAEDPEAVIRSGRVRMSGDPDTAADFRALLEMIRPDWEEELSKVTGDVISHEASEFAGSVGRWMERARRSLGRSMSEYLTEESRALATTVEIGEFCKEVDKLSEAVDRAEAQLKQLRAQRAKD